MCDSPQPRPSLRAALTLLALLGLLAGAPTPSTAQTGGTSQEKLEELPQEQKEKFIEFIKAGKEAYSAGDFRKAIPFFEKAYDIVPNPALHYRIALCHERSDQPAQALEHYKKFLELEPDTEKRGAVETTIEDLEKQVEEASVARVSIKSDPTDAKVSVRSASADESTAEKRGRTPIDLELEAGEIAITLTKEGHASTEEVVEVEAGETYNFSYTLKEKPSTASAGTDTETETDPTASASSGSSLPIGPLVMGGAGALVGGGLYGFGLHINSKRPQFGRGLYNAIAIGAYTAGAVALGGLGWATYEILSGGGQGGSSAQASRNDLQLKLQLTGTGIRLTGEF